MISYKQKRKKHKKQEHKSLITKKEMRDSISSTALAFRGMKNGQLTENSVIFDDVIKGSGINIHLSLFFKNQAPFDFDVKNWYEVKTLVMKERISNLMLDIALGDKFQKEYKDNFLNQQSGFKLARCVTSDVVDGEQEDIIGYLFQIEYNRF